MLFVTGKYMSRACICLFVMQFAAFSLRAQAGITHRVLAVSGQQAPGTPDGVVFDTLYFSSRINASGQVVFTGTLAGPQVTGSNNTGMWSVRNGNTDLLVRTGDPAPNGPVGATIIDFDSPFLNKAGHTSFLAFIANGPNRAIYSHNGTSFELAARRDDPAPGMGPGVTFSSFDEHEVRGGANHLAFKAGTSSNVSGIWAYHSGTLTPVLRRTDPVPDTPAGTAFQFYDVPVINNLGHTAFTSTITGGGVETWNNNGLWVYRDGVTRLAIRKGDSLSGIIPVVGSVLMGTIRGPSINDAGSLLFSGDIERPLLGIDYRALWLKTDAGLSLVAQEDGHAPGITGAVFTAFNNYNDYGPQLNSSNQVAFLADYKDSDGADPSNKGIWLYDSGSTQLIAYTDGVAPGLEQEARFTSVSQPFMNGKGHIVFEASYAFTGSDGTSGRGIWASNPDGQLQLLIEIGDLVDVDDDPNNEEWKTIASIGINTRRTGGGEDGRAIKLNDRGELVYRVTFTDGSSGIMVSTIPEPAGLAVAILMPVMLLRRIRGY